MSDSAPTDVWVAQPPPPDRPIPISVTITNDPATGDEDVIVNTLPWPALTRFSVSFMAKTLLSNASPDDDAIDHIPRLVKRDGWTFLVLDASNARAVYRMEYDSACTWYVGTLVESEVDLASLTERSDQ